MAIDQQGIMALPEGQQAMMPQLSYSDSYDAMRQALQQVNPEVDAELQQTLNGLRATLTNVSDEELQQLIDAVQTLIDDPEGYARNIAQAVQEGDLEAGVFPEEYDEEFLGSVLSVLLDEQRTRQAGPGMMMPPPQQFARGGIADAARLVASKGRNGDTMLAHITPSEARLLRSRGGSGTINPETGLPEYFLKGLFRGIGKVFSAIGSAVKSVLKSPIGRIVGTIALSTILGPGAFGIQGLGLSTAAAAGVSSGVIAGLSGGSLKDILISAGTGFLGAAGGPVSEFIGSKVANPFIRDALVGAGVGAAAGLLQGQKLKDAVKGGLTAGAISGGMSYLQSRGNLQVAKADAEQAAAAKTSPAITDIAEDITGTATRPTSTPGLFAKTTTYADGRVVEQMVDGRGTPIGPPTPVGAAPISASPVPIGQAPVSVEPAVVPGTTGYLESAKQNIIGRSMGVPTAPTPAQIANIQPPVDVSSFDAFQNLRSVTPATVGPSGVPSTISTGGYRYEGGPPRPMPASTANVSTAPRIGAPYQTTTPSQYTIPEVGQSLSTMGRGAKDFLSGDFSKGTKTFMEGAEDLFFPGPSDEQIRRYAAEKGITPAKAAQEIGAPGFMRTYGPGVVAATGIGALAGAFERQEPPESEFAKQMRAPIDLSVNPRAYYIQDIPGAIYDERGSIVGIRSLPIPSRYAEGGEVSEDRLIDMMNAGYRKFDPNIMGSRMSQEEANMLNAKAPFLYGTIPGTVSSQYPAGRDNNKAREQLYNLYEEKLGRAPDMAGFNYWIDQFGKDDVIDAAETQRFLDRAKQTENYVEKTTTGNAAATGQQATNQQATNQQATNQQATNQQVTGQQNVVPRSLTLADVRAPTQSYINYQRKYASPDSVTPVTPVTPTQPSIQDQTAALFKQYVGIAPDQSQLDYWSGIFGLDNQITPDEITRLQDAARNTGKTPSFMNMGGIAALKQGGYPRRTGQISGPGTETSDSIPAMLSDGEFVMTARAVRGMGNGSRRDGARKMYALMHKLERNAARG